MAKMYPDNISEYMPTDSERFVYNSLKTQLPDTFDVFYSVEWTTFRDGNLVKSEADFIIASPDYGFLCLEVKGGNSIRVENNVWYVDDSIYGERRLNCSPYEQAEKSMYYFHNMFSNKYNTEYQGTFGAGAVFPFYAIGDDIVIDNRNRNCTIDCNDMNNIYIKIKKMFKFWAGASFGIRYYPESQHKAFLELVKERIALSAAAGALVKYKENQFDIINRVQDNYVYFLTNIKQFFIKGGAGTGKTWIAMKMANTDSSEGKSVLFVCYSRCLSDFVKQEINNKRIACLSTNELFASPFCKRKYDSIYVDEAQDLDTDTAEAIRSLLKDPLNSRLGVFYDDVQILREDSFGDGFKIKTKPYLLRENIRNTSSIYNWTSKKTNLGMDVISNPVEGPEPVTETVNEQGQLTLRLESIFKRFLDEESLPSHSLVIITDDVKKLLKEYSLGIAKWKLVRDFSGEKNQIRVVSV